MNDVFATTNNITIYISVNDQWFSFFSQIQVKFYVSSLPEP